MERLAPTAPENIVALYQRAVFTQGTIWQIDSIEPCGAELEKALAARIICELEIGAEGRLGYLFHNRPKSGAMYEPAMQRLLPLDDEWRRGLSKLAWPAANLPEVLAGGESTLRALIREYLFISLFRACAESLASENASRLAAMQRAEKNIDELLEDLNQTFHRQRQSTIDEELFDVISGFEALRAPVHAKAPPAKMKGS